MPIGLTFEEYVELKLMPPNHADRAFVTAAEHMRDEAFPMSLSQAAWHVRTRGYDCRPESLELLVKQQTVEPVDADAWTRADVDAVCDYFEQHGFYVPYAEACRVLGCSYASFLRALKDAAERETAKYGIQVRADDQLFVMHRVPPRDDRDAVNYLSMFIDVQASLLFYLVASWEDDFTGYVIDYGTWPDQHRPYFTLRDARQTLAAATKSNGIEGAIFTGLESLTRDLLNREWRRDDGALLRVDRCLIDANWGSSTDVIYQFCRQSAHAGIVMPSHGRFVGASSQPFSEYKRRPGDRVGHNWRIPNVHGKRAVRHVVYDTNYWKTFVHARLAVPMGDRGCLSLFGQASESHRLLAEQLTSEYRVKTEGRGRTVDEWKLRPERGDNHWFDCLVGSAVAASMQGVALLGMDPVNQKRRERVSFAELQRRNRQ